MKRYVKIAFLCCFLAVNPIFTQQYWISQSSPTSNFLYKCVFTDTLYGWAIGEGGTIVSTTNSGVNWLIQTSGVTQTLNDVFFTDRNSGWIVYYNSTGQTNILKTTNGGINWVNNPFPDTTAIFNNLYFRNSQTGFLGGYSGIFKTTNGGANWFAGSLDTAGCFFSMPSRDITFANDLTGYACGGVYDIVGVVWKTTTGGLNWFSWCLSPEPVSELIAVTPQNVIAMGGDFEFGGISVLTTNGGTNWKYDNIGCYGDVKGFSFRTAGEVWAALSFAGMFAVNIDSLKPGSTWQCINTPDTSLLYDVEFQSPTKGWSVGAGGKIYRYNPAVIGISSNNNTLPRTFELFQNYPNPFNPFSLIKYSLPGAENVSLILYDAKGQQVRIYNEGFKQAGTHSIEINASELSSGVYFYKLTAGKFSESRKLVVIK